MKNRTLEDLRTQCKDAMNNISREVKELPNNNLSTDTYKATMVEMKDLSEKKLNQMMKGYKENGYIIIAPFYGKPQAGYYLIANHWLKTMKQNIDDLLEQIGLLGSIMPGAGIVTDANLYCWNSKAFQMLRTIIEK